MLKLFEDDDNIAWGTKKNKMNNIFAKYRFFSHVRIELQIATE